MYALIIEFITLSNIRFFGTLDTGFNITFIKKVTTATATKKEEDSANINTIEVSKSICPIKPCKKTSGRYTTIEVMTDPNMDGPISSAARNILSSKGLFLLR